MAPVGVLKRLLVSLHLLFLGHALNRLGHTGVLLLFWCFILGIIRFVHDAT